MPVRATRSSNSSPTAHGSRSASATVARCCRRCRKSYLAPRIGRDARAIGQIPICWDPDEDAAVARAHEQFRWFGGGWKVNADLPTPAGFAGATTYDRPEDVAASIPCGPDLDQVVEAVSAYWEAGFTDVALVQVGDEGQDRFLAEAAGPLLEKLRAAAPS